MVSCLYKGQIGFEFLGASFSSFGCFVFDLGCSVPRSSFSSASFSKLPLAGVPNLGKPLYREKTVYIKTHKTAINRPVDHTGET